MKSLFHMASLVAVRFSDDLKKYYARKTQDEKKNKMSVLNAVRECKLNSVC